MVIKPILTLLSETSVTGKHLIEKVKMCRGIFGCNAEKEEWSRFNQEIGKVFHDAYKNEDDLPAKDLREKLRIET